MTEDIAVIKISGKVTDDKASLAVLGQSVKDLLDEGTFPIIVHGGGRQLSNLSERLGLTPTFIAGRRVTCAETLEAAQMAFLGLVQPTIVAAIGRVGVSAVGLSGADGRTLIAMRRPPTPVDYGFVGNIIVIQTALINALRGANCVPVISSLATAPDGTLLNVNADTVAAELAIAFKAKSLIMISDTPGIMTDPKRIETVMPTLTLADAEAMEKSGAATDGMLPKISAIARALKGGMSQVLVTGPNALPKLNDLCRGRTATGTLVTHQPEAMQ